LVTCGRDTTGEIPKINNLLRSGVGGVDLGLTGTERRAFLTFAKPTNRTAILEYNTTIHAAELKERKKSTISN
jgi:acetyl-CoA carboxylase carboxyltransferase component